MQRALKPPEVRNLVVGPVPQQLEDIKPGHDNHALDSRYNAAEVSYAVREQPKFIVIHRNRGLSSATAV